MCLSEVPASGPAQALRARRPAIANCGDCLMDHAEIVPMRVSVTSTYTLVTTALILVFMR